MKRDAGGSRGAVDVFEAAEVLTYALVGSDAELAAEARRMADTAVAGDRRPVDAETRAQVAAADPVSAAVLGWLDFPSLRKAVRSSPGETLDPEEQAVFAADTSDQTLRLIVLARADGRPVAEVVQAASTAGGNSGFALAARDDAATAAQVLNILHDEGLLGRPEQ